MKVYHYHEETREFLGSSDANPNPLEPGNFLLPASATFTEPMEKDPGTAIMFVGDDSWALVPDLRGKKIFNKTTSEIRIHNTIGYPPEGFSADLTGLFSTVTARGTGINRQAVVGELERVIPWSLVDMFMDDPNRFWISNEQVVEHTNYVEEQNALYLEQAKELKREAIRARLLVEERMPVTTEWGTFNGGEGSAGAINGTIQLAQFLAEPTVILTDINNVEGVYTFEQAAAITVQIGVAARAAFFHKQERMRAVDAAVSLAELELVNVW